MTLLRSFYHSISVPRQSGTGKHLLPRGDCSWKSLDASSLWRHHSAWRYQSLAEALSYYKWSAIAAITKDGIALQSSFDLLNLHMGGWTYHSCHVILFVFKRSFLSSIAESELGILGEPRSQDASQG
jgi:hypothetical protein